jgi:hypothetical protein
MKPFLNPFRKSTRTEKSPSRSKEENREGNENYAWRDERGSEREEGRVGKRGHAEIIGSKERKQQGKKRRE